MTHLEEEFSRRMEEMKKAAGEASRDMRKLATDLQEQAQYLVEDLRKRGRGDSPFQESPIEKIKALAQLRGEGILTEEEFQTQKQKLLEEI